MEINPRHDQFSHGADAFTYFATALISGILDINLNNITHKMREFEDYTQQKRTEYDPMNSYLDEMKGSVA